MVPHDMIPCCPENEEEMGTVKGRERMAAGKK
jgi:hypothetical protein